MNYKEVKLALEQIHLKPKKYLGQNFIINTNLLRKIITLSELKKKDKILEVGPGLGALTEHFLDNVNQIYAIEIDPLLSKYLSEKFSIYKNIEIINGDILEIEIPKHNKVISNLPYSITGPILEKLFFKQNPSQAILTIEKKIADRIFLSGNYKDFSRISIGVNAFMRPALKHPVSRNSFYPSPQIDLSLIKLIPREEVNSFLHDEASITFFLKFIAGIMPYKNKNITNALFLGFKANKTLKYSKEAIIQIVNEHNYENKKVFNFQIEELIELSRIFYSLRIN
ncbi:MAG: 16S rRNA (adenine(1518)-N(6)/adenine(1519)-N(6))-dimethyltransferase RsmA [Candidatus Thorarchaeota archaeon]